MSSTVGPDSNPEDEGGKALGVRFAESSVGKPIIAGLLFVTGSFWLTIAAVGVLVTVAAIAMSDRLVAGFVVGDGTIAGITGIFGLSAIFVGLLGYGIYRLVAYRADRKD